TMAGNVTVTPGLAAIFTVTSSSGNDACRLVSSAFDCTFNASASTGNPTSYAWSYTVAGITVPPPAQTNAATITPTTNSCGLFAGVTGDKTSLSFVNMPVTLTVTNSAGQQSATTNNNVRVLPIRPNPGCGF